jgi:hypothetical protein
VKLVNDERVAIAEITHKYTCTGMRCAGGIEENKIQRTTNVKTIGNA